LYSKKKKTPGSDEASAENQGEAASLSKDGQTRIKGKMVKGEQK